MTKFALRLSVFAFLLAGPLLGLEAGPSVPLFFVRESHAAERPNYVVRLPGSRVSFEPGGFALGFRQVDVRVSFEGCDREVMPEGVGTLPAKVNFLIGSDPREWRTGLPAHSSIVYRDLYPGIDAIYRSHGTRLKSDFVVAPQSDPSRIRLRYSFPVRVDAEGALIVSTGVGDLREEAPVIYQERDGIRIPVKGSYRVRPGGAVGFDIDPYDRGLQLVIDPVLTYSTFLGGGGLDGATAIAVDSAGNAYVAGWTESTDFPTKTPRQAQNLGGVDAFVVKLSPTGGALVYATYLGGRGDDRAFGIAVDSAGAAYICGRTGSIGFPILSAVQATLGGGRDGWVAKLNASGTALVYGTYFGGTGDDSANGIAIDNAGNAYVTGDTTSPNFRTLNAFQGARQGGLDAFAAKFGPSGALAYSTYLGGAGDDRGAAIAADSAGVAYVTGATDSIDFPILNAIQPVSGGSQDAFIVRLGATGTFAYGTYAGGSGGTVGTPETGTGIAVDGSGNIFVTGSTSSSNFPRVGTPPSVFAGISDCFVLKLNPSGAVYIYSTLLGGGNADYCSGIAVTAGGVAYVAGYTASSDLPSPGALQGVNAGGLDGLIARLSGTGALDFATYLGGSGADKAAAIALDSTGAVYVAGQTQSNDFQLSNALQTFNGGRFGAFVVKFKDTPPGIPTVTPSSGAGSNQTFSFEFSTPTGSAAIDSIDIIFNSTASGPYSCFLRIFPGSKLLTLFYDDGTDMIGSPMGSQGVIENSRCAVDNSLASVSVSGPKVTFIVNIAFKPLFAGSWGIFTLVFGPGKMPGWERVGSWTAVAPVGYQPPSLLELSPGGGSGSGAMFRLVFSDPDGNGDIDYGQLLINSTFTGVGSCNLEYNRGDGRVYLANDSFTSFAGGLVPGSVGTLSNSQCRLDGPSSSVVLAGGNVTLTLALTFTTAFAGGKTSYVFVVDKHGLTRGWQGRGTWNVNSNLGRAPTISGSPTTGIGRELAFAMAATDTDGYVDLRTTRILINAVKRTFSACYIIYDALTNKVYLYDDTGTTSSFLTPAAAGSLSNSQCAIDGPASSVSKAGNNLTLNLAITFTAAFSGTKTFLGYASDTSAASGWQNLASWTVP